MLSVAARGFPDAKVGCRAQYGGLKCIPGKFFLSAKENRRMTVFADSLLLHP